MKRLVKPFSVLLFWALFFVQAFAQVFENTYMWHDQAHSAWKIATNNPTGYVIGGSKFFEPGNTSLYITGFDEFGTHQWTRSHASGFTSLSTFWKSYCNVPGFTGGYFFVCAGESSGHKAYALQVNAVGTKLWDAASPLPNGIEFGGVTTATNGGYIATGSTNQGTIAVVKFNNLGFIEWVKNTGVSGFGWTIAQAVGGGYVIAGTKKVVRVDYAGNLEWSTTLNLPTSPSGAYTYTEFEEILPLPDYTGFVVTGSCFSNLHSGIYTARVNYSGSVQWAKVQDQVNTTLAGTPVCWVNNAILDGYGTEIVTSWRRGPVSTGGTLISQRMNMSGVNIGTPKSMLNTIPVQEAFWTKAHGKYVVGGTRGSYSAAYSYVNADLPGFQGDTEDRNDETTVVPEAIDPLARLQTSIYNAKPIFEYPQTSRVFTSEMRVFPNPATGQINVGGAIEPGALLRVVSIMGQVVLEQRIAEGETQVSLDLSTVSPGIYNVEMVGEKNVTTRRIIMQK
jgi:hypothetical protein